MKGPGKTTRTVLTGLVIGAAGIVGAPEAQADEDLCRAELVVDADGVVDVEGVGSVNVGSDGMPVVNMQSGLRDGLIACGVIVDPDTKKLGNPCPDNLTEIELIEGEESLTGFIIQSTVNSNLVLASFDGNTRSALMVRVQEDEDGRSAELSQLTPVIDSYTDLPNGKKITTFSGTFATENLLILPVYGPNGEQLLDDTIRITISTQMWNRVFFQKIIGIDYKDNTVRMLLVDRDNGQYTELSFAIDPETGQPVDNRVTETVYPQGEAVSFPETDEDGNEVRIINIGGRHYTERLCPPDDPEDADEDGVLDGDDNCPTNANPGQEDQDGDDTGDVCDRDIDGDNIDNEDENEGCETDPDPECGQTQEVCGPGAPDSDNDGICDEADNCVQLPNDDQADADGDGFGDDCDDQPDGGECSDPVAPSAFGQQQQLSEEQQFEKDCGVTDLDGSAVKVIVNGEPVCVQGTGPGVEGLVFFTPPSDQKTEAACTAAVDAMLGKPCNTQITVDYVCPETGDEVSRDIDEVEGGTVLVDGNEIICQVPFMVLSGDASGDAMPIDVRNALEEECDAAASDNNDNNETPDPDEKPPAGPRGEPGCSMNAAPGGAPSNNPKQLAFAMALAVLTALGAASREVSQRS